MALKYNDYKNRVVYLSILKFESKPIDILALGKSVFLISMAFDDLVPLKSYDSDPQQVGICFEDSDPLPQEEGRIFMQDIEFNKMIHQMMHCAHTKRPTA